MIINYKCAVDGILSMQSVFRAQTTKYQINPFFVDSSSFI